MKQPFSTPTFITITTFLLFSLSFLHVQEVHANAPCSLPMQCRRKGGCPTRYPPCYYATKSNKVGHTSHSAPLASFRGPKQSLEHIKVLGGKIKDKVGRALDRVKQKIGERNAGRAAEKQQQQQQVNTKNKNKKGGKGAFGVQVVERSLFSFSPASSADPADDEECAPGQDLHHPHHHYNVNGNPSSSTSSSSSSSNNNNKPTSPSSASSYDDNPDHGPAVFLLGRSNSFDTAALHQIAQHTHTNIRRQPRRGALTYGHALVNFVGFAVKLLAVLLFQVLGTALVVNEYQTSGLVSQTLLKFSSLLAGLAFVPPLVVAMRESLPSHSRNPLVRGFARLFELALDCVCVGALSLLASVLLTAVMSLPSYNFLLSRQLGEEYIKGALSAGFVFFFLWAYSRNFEWMASKWFI